MLKKRRMFNMRYKRKADGANNKIRLQGEIVIPILLLPIRWS